MVHSYLPITFKNRKAEMRNKTKPYTRISVSASVLVASLTLTLSGGQWLAVLIGFKPLPGSLQAAPIALSCGWTEVSLSLRMGLRHKWHHYLFIAWAKSLAVYRF
ncbi:hypothetical protein [Paenibacillus sp. 32352]|uniref:hypothetical protein n=1 Tax=Paenibacillus sp. 32352 TaxID=1969111 RepID=UPI00117FAFAF|nr:hypothetical protein [Paenibacillus sp. 32352]